MLRQVKPVRQLYILPEFSNILTLSQSSSQIIIGFVLSIKSCDYPPANIVFSCLQTFWIQIFTYLWNSHFLNCLKCSKSNSKEHNINACFPAKSGIDSGIIDQNWNFVIKKCLGMFPKNCPIIFFCHITSGRNRKKKMY